MNTFVRTVLLWVVALPALAVEFVMVPGSDIGLTPMRDHVLACRETGRTAWPWGATGFHDSSGSYLYFTYHGSCGRSILFKLGYDGLYEEIPTPNMDGKLTGTRNPNWVGVGWPTEDRPLVGDFNNDGCIDIIQTGDETSGGSASAMTDGTCGEWVLKESWKTQHGGRDPATTINGRLGYQPIKGSGGKTIAYSYIGSDDGFIRDFKEIDYSGEPPEIQDLLAESDFRYLYVEKFQYSDSCYVLSQGGSYQGRRWTRTICDGGIVDTGLPPNGAVVAMLDLGVPYMAVQGSGEHGMYKLEGDSFVKDTAGDMPIINGDVKREPLDTGLEGGAYKDGFWVADLDLDGDNDFVMTNHRNDIDYVMENRDGVFVLAERIYSADGVSMQVTDLDGDGDKDIVSIGNGDRRCSPRDCPNAVVYYNQAIESGAVITNPDPNPEPAPDPKPEPTPDPKISELADRAEANQEFIWTLESRLNAVGADLDYAKDKNEELLEQIEELKAENPKPAPIPKPEPPINAEPVVIESIPLPDHDPQSDQWASWVTQVGSDGGRAYDHALISVVTGDADQCTTAIDKAQGIVDANTVSGNQYLAAGRLYSAVFQTLSWCDVPDEQASQWAAWGRGHLGETDGSVGSRSDKIWWANRWSRNNPANNYYHSFIVATTVYAMAVGDEEWLTWLREDRLPRLSNYYARTPEGGSREGTGYGESIREILRIAKMWRDHDGTEILPQAFIDNTIRYWSHALSNDGRRYAMIGDQTRAKGKTDGYHCDIFDNALALTEDPEVTAIANWRIGQINCFSSSVFRRLILRDYPQVQRPVMDTAYYAVGAGHFFARPDWDDPNATLFYAMAGKRDEAHQCEDQGGFGIFADRERISASASFRTKNGTCGRASTSTENVLRLTDRVVNGSTSTLDYELTDQGVQVLIDASEAYGRPYLREMTVNWQARQMTVVDEVEGANDAVFGLDAAGGAQAVKTGSSTNSVTHMVSW